MKQRLLVAAVGVPLLIVILVILPPVATAILTAAIAGAAAYELLHTAGKRVPIPVYCVTVLCAALGVLAGALSLDTALHVVRWALVMVLFLYAVLHFGNEEKALSFRDLAVALVGGVVFPALYGFLARLRNLGAAFVLMPFVVAFIGDSFSMLGGMAFGHRKFAPHVSPNKTWAGFIAGPVGSALGMVLLALVRKWLWQMELPVWYLALIGVVANVFGQLGDLSTSLIKREAGVKDYSHIFLTHGGVLDRFDSILFIAPVVYAMLYGLEALA